MAAYWVHLNGGNECVSLGLDRDTLLTKGIGKRFCIVAGLPGTKEPLEPEDTSFVVLDGLDETGSGEVIGDVHGDRLVQVGEEKREARRSSPHRGASMRRLRWEPEVLSQNHASIARLTRRQKAAGGMRR